MSAVEYCKQSKHHVNPPISTFRLPSLWQDLEPDILARKKVQQRGPMGLDCFISQVICATKNTQSDCCAVELPVCRANALRAASLTSGFFRNAPVSSESFMPDFRISDL